MKSQPDPKNYPQKEGHPEPFPKVTTMPSGWDLSELVNSPTVSEETGQNALPLELDSQSVVEDLLE